MNNINYEELHLNLLQDLGETISNYWKDIDIDHDKHFSVTIGAINGILIAIFIQFSKKDADVKVIKDFLDELNDEAYKIITKGLKHKTDAGGFNCDCDG